MTDVHNQITRSKNMAAITGKDTRPEIWVRKALHRRGYRFRLHDQRLPGKPDIVLPKYRAIIFVHGCFWHGHGCHQFRWPATREAFWRSKIEGNRRRDQSVVAQLREDDWRVLTVWECGLKGRLRLEAETLTNLISRWIEQGEDGLELQGELHDDQRY